MKISYVELSFKVRFYTLNIIIVRSRWVFAGSKKYIGFILASERYNYPRYTEILLNVQRKILLILYIYLDLAAHIYVKTKIVGFLALHY